MKEQKLIDTPTFQVKDNTLWFEHYFLQISNISQVSAREAETIPVRYAVACIVVGLLFLSAKLFWVSFLAIGIGAALFYYIYHKKQNPEYNLYIGLNSGQVFRFHCATEGFANAVMEALRECINSPHASINVDFANSEIHGSKFIFGNQNQVSH